MLKILLALETPIEDITTLIAAHKVDMLRECEALLKMVGANSYDLILIEGKTDVLPSIKAVDPRAEIVLLGHKQEDVFESIRQGACAYYLFPVKIDRLKETIDSVDDMVALRRENAGLEKQLSTNYTFFNGVVGRNPRMLDIFTLLKRIAPYYKIATVTGETGTGKEIIAKALHSLSHVSREPFVVCDCGTLVENLAESELFGHKRGSFTGAIEDRAGFFELVGDGTLFLDEIGELPLPSQASLLRVLQSSDFRRVGGRRVLRATCKIIAATNKDLQEEVKNGNFREDLFYRLTPIKLDVPPLRERKDDIPLLIRYFLKKFGDRTGKRVLGISRPAQIIVMSHYWPGNIRELENVVEQAAILTSEPFIGIDDLPKHLGQISSKKNPRRPVLLDDVIKEHIEEVLTTCKGNKSRASRLLGISRRSLIRRIEKYSVSYY